jgi:hypothetical protein
MEMDLPITRPLTRRSRLLSGFCPSVSPLPPRFLPVPPRGGAVANCQHFTRLISVTGRNELPAIPRLRYVMSNVHDYHKAKESLSRNNTRKLTACPPPHAPARLFFLCGSCYLLSGAGPRCRGGEKGSTWNEKGSWNVGEIAFQPQRR